MKKFEEKMNELMLEAASDVTWGSWKRAPKTEEHVQEGKEAAKKEAEVLNSMVTKHFNGANTVSINMYDLDGEQGKAELAKLGDLDLEDLEKAGKTESIQMDVAELGSKITISPHELDGSNVVIYKTRGNSYLLIGKEDAEKLGFKTPILTVQKYIEG